jgi:alkylation response protein AidB-like acyl-CoA dehydrogenase
MTHYRSNQRDIEFNLFELFAANERLGRGPFTQVDTATAKTILSEVNRFASEELSRSYASSDRNPPVYDPVSKTVTMPEDFVKDFRALMDSGWWSLDLPERLGGVGAPASLRWAVSEMLLGANPAAFMYMAGPSFAAILHELGTTEQKRLAELAIENMWGATMVLTEPDAGSDVGAGRTKATEQADGSWHIEGVKRFITSGEQNMTANILHLVLARSEGAGAGTKGLSLFVVPKFHVDLQTGQLGARNGVYATNVEKKMGLKASTTCEMMFGENEPAVGWLVGGVHNGIAQMFKVIEYARMMVGTKAIAALSTGYLGALDYAKTREQGADLASGGSKNAPRVPIIRHPDVRGGLMLQKTYAEGMRALVAYTAYWQDLIEMGEQNNERDGVTDMAERMNNLLLPIVKGFGSERSYEMLAVSLQTFGGSGYLQDYPVEQYLRDSKIDTLYEGTTAIQGLDLFFRKMIRDEFTAITYLAEEILRTASSESAHLVGERELLRAAVEDVQAIIAMMGGWAYASQSDAEEIYKVASNSTRLLMAVGDLIVGWLLLRQGEIAYVALEKDINASEQAFYRGKIQSAQWFATRRLPLLAAERAIVANTNNDIMNMGDDSF